ncbi:glycine zipper 2TM domain-containing protein [Asticcacaulis sp. EMRT-3]|uniref:glycine zipper 2TM domain-containing protein n=1 Tax=Asticcacaulis sp. EMRT-3 TaxID=3040349 RepID=UPI0024AF1BE1|nr:glycine zipper 2TM domain-containing protein [Asticcacaulis sp. EMRT-3]MDI7775722.1 glycine zipper 2TM domain-containing protein [Asticcacaulis sp. EMRT-3]
MQKFAQKILTAVVTTGLIAASVTAIPAAAEARPAYGCHAVVQHKAQNGTIIGALLGGAIGGSVANTHNKGLGTVAGAVVGGLVGNSVGKDNGREDCQQARNDYRHPPVRYQNYDRHNYNNQRSYNSYSRNDGHYDARR